VAGSSLEEDACFSAEKRVYVLYGKHLVRSDKVRDSRCF
jgi:hypothetical protein